MSQSYFIPSMSDDELRDKYIRHLSEEPEVNNRSLHFAWSFFKNVAEIEARRRGIALSESAKIGDEPR